MLKVAQRRQGAKGGGLCISASLRLCAPQASRRERSGVAGALGRAAPPGPGLGSFGVLKGRSPRRRRVLAPNAAGSAAGVTPPITRRARKRLRADSGDRRARAEALPRRILRIGSTSRSAAGPTWEIAEVVQKRFRAQAGDRRVTQAARLDRAGARPRALGSDSRGRCCRGGRPTTERRVAAEVVEALRARGDHHARLGDPSRRGTGSMG